MDLSWFREHLVSTDKNKNYIPTGWEQLDGYITGFLKANLSIIGARPAQGKTTFLQNIVYNLPEENHLVFPTENSREYWMERFLGIMSGIDSKRIKTKSSDIMSELEPHLENLAKRRITVINGYNPSPWAIRKYIERYKPTFVTFDYFQNIATSSGDAFDYAKRLEELHKIAMDFKIPVVLGSQARRLGAGEALRPPRMSDLKGTGKQEEAAKLCIMLHQDKGQVVAEIVKNNDGPVGTVRFNVEWGCNRMSESI